MATAHLHFPRPFFTAHWPRLWRWNIQVVAPEIRPRDVAVLCLSVAACCAALVFAGLYKSDQRYPVAPVREHAMPLAAAAPAPIVQPMARTHDELLALERLGERNYIEFSLLRSDSFQPVGPLALGVWRTDTRHDAVEASVLLAAHRIDLKEVKVNELVTIPVGHSQALELVVNRVTKDQVAGYVSEPKDKGWQLAQNTISSAPNPTQR